MILGYQSLKVVQLLPRLDFSETELLRLKGALSDFHTGEGPKLIVAKIDPGAPPRVMPTRDAVENKLTFRRAILGG